MPLRQGTNHDCIAAVHSPSVVLPQTDRHFCLEQLSSDVANGISDTSPPTIPKRRPSLTQNDILSMPLLEHEQAVYFHARRNSTSTWGSIASFANHDNLEENHKVGLPNDDTQDTVEVPTTERIPCGQKDTTTAAADTATSQSISTRERRTKALQWFHRFGMPDRDSMKEQVKRSTGIDISVDDVDLLPWDDHRYRRTGWASLCHPS
jgi:hypothetical protein